MEAMSQACKATNANYNIYLFIWRIWFKSIYRNFRSSTHWFDQAPVLWRKKSSIQAPVLYHVLQNTPLSQIEEWTFGTWIDFIQTSTATQAHCRRSHQSTISHDNSHSICVHVSLYLNTLFHHLRYLLPSWFLFKFLQPLVCCSR